MNHKAVIQFDSFSVSTVAVNIFLNNRWVVYVWRNIVALSHKVIPPRLS